MSVEEPVVHTIEGERDGKASLRVLSMQSRVSNILAFGLMAVLGLGSLTWYYAMTLSRQGHAKESALAASTKRAEGDLPLPSLGPIAPEATVPSEGPAAGTLTASTLTEIPLAPSVEPAIAAAPAQKSPEQLALERQLSGAVYGGAGGAESTTADYVAVGGQGTSAPGMGSGRGGGFEPGRGESDHGEQALASLLHAPATSAAQAHMLPTQRLLLPKGAFIDCTLETAIDSTLPGMTTCVMATDAFGVDGQVVLLERGTKLIGETRGQVQQGAARIFVLWTEAAILVSVIDGGIQAATQSSNGGAGTVIVNPAASQDALTAILKNTISIPPTIVKHNGDRIQVLVARDLDFRAVYELHALVTQH
jgi:type IV secretion system protein VirB10